MNWPVIDTVTGCQLAIDGGRMPAGSVQRVVKAARLVHDPTVEAIELELERILT